MKVTNVTPKAQALWERADFIPCRLGDAPPPHTEAAILPGLDGLLRSAADGLQATNRPPITARTR